MELSEALKIVQLLSDGIDPETGEVLDDESTFNEPQVIRALAVAVKALERVHVTTRTLVGFLRPVPSE